MHLSGLSGEPGEFHRYYNSAGYFDNKFRKMRNDDFWRHNWSQKVVGYVDEYGKLNNAHVTSAVIRPDGTVRYFAHTGAEIQNRQGQSWRMQVILLEGAVAEWRVMEASSCFDPPIGCSTAGLTLPVVEYGRDEGCSIIGGPVYRGCRMPGHHGHYFYSDFCSGFVRSFRYEGGAAVDRRDWTADLGAGLSRPSAFGVDADGEMYLVSLDGAVFRIVPAAP